MPFPIKYSYAEIVQKEGDSMDTDTKKSLTPMLVLHANRTLEKSIQTGRYGEFEAGLLAHVLGVEFAREAFDLPQFIQGLNIEVEHTKPPFDVAKNDVDVARIALAHLQEAPDYYEKLAQVEGKAMADDPFAGHDDLEKSHVKGYYRLVNGKQEHVQDDLELSLAGRFLEDLADLEKSIKKMGYFNPEYAKVRVKYPGLRHAQRNGQKITAIFSDSDPATGKFTQHYKATHYIGFGQTNRYAVTDGQHDVRGVVSMPQIHEAAMKELITASKGRMNEDNPANWTAKPKQPQLKLELSRKCNNAAL
jgi:hypothetical protein